MSVRVAIMCYSILALQMICIYIYYRILPNYSATKIIIHSSGAFIETEIFALDLSGTKIRVALSNKSKFCG